jgi:hypothetical protein
MTIRISRDPIYLRRRFSAETIELCVRWYITYRLSYRDLVAMMTEREIAVSHTTVMRWVLRYVPEYERRWARFARSPGSSWRMDETAVNVRGGRHYLYRAVDRDGKSVASLLCRDRSMGTSMEASIELKSASGRKMTIMKYEPNGGVVGCRGRTFPGNQEVSVDWSNAGVIRISISVVSAISKLNDTVDGLRVTYEIGTVISRDCGFART